MSAIKTKKLGKKQPKIREDQSIIGLQSRFFNRMLQLKSIK